MGLETIEQYLNEVKEIGFMPDGRIYLILNEEYEAKDLDSEMQSHFGDNPLTIRFNKEGKNVCSLIVVDNKTSDFSKSCQMEYNEEHLADFIKRKKGVKIQLSLMYLTFNLGQPGGIPLLDNTIYTTLNIQGFEVA